MTEETGVDVEVESPKPAKLPDRLTIKAWNEGVVDLTDLGQGRIILRDAPYTRCSEWIDHKGSLLRGSTLLARAYCRKFQQMQGPAFHDPVEKWEEWMGELDTKLVAALLDCVGR